MDSFTQIVLGAACGEAVAGKKIGNKAILWGAVGGTIPDLDVLATMFVKPIDAIAFHRGFMHSFLFAGLAPFVLAWLATRLRRKGKTPGLGFQGWYALFFWSIFTHPILDCFTNFGTQIWQPFSAVRIQWSTVSIADPLATLPFALCLLVVMFLKRSDRRRMIWNWIGIGWFCAYLAYTVWHKAQVDHLFRQALQEQGIRYRRIYTNPVILNNIVWYGIAEGERQYYYGQMCFTDPRPRFDTLDQIPVREDLMAKLPSESEAGRFVRWFSEGFYNITPLSGDTIQVNDLRFGVMGERFTGNNYVFSFGVYPQANGQLALYQRPLPRERMDEAGTAFKALWNRIFQKNASK